jgi:thiol-disulfide isomerase/thioredoxin
MLPLFAFLALAGSWSQFTYTDTVGVAHTSGEWTGKKAIVFFFVMTECPLSNGYVPEMNRIARDYGPRGVIFYAVQGDTTVPLEDVRRHAREFGYTFPYLIDPSESLAARTGATTAPEAAVVSLEGKVLYLGRIDDWLIDFGKKRLRPTQFDLRDALDAALTGKPVAHPRTRALGCSITRATGEMKGIPQ